MLPELKASDENTTSNNNNNDNNGNNNNNNVSNLRSLFEGNNKKEDEAAKKVRELKFAKLEEETMKRRTIQLGTFVRLFFLVFVIFFLQNLWCKSKSFLPSRKVRKAPVRKIWLRP
jgi:hypothetical protein